MAKSRADLLYLKQTALAALTAFSFLSVYLQLRSEEVKITDVTTNTDDSALLT